MNRRNVTSTRSPTVKCMLGLHRQWTDYQAAIDVCCLILFSESDIFIYRLFSINIYAVLRTDLTRRNMTVLRLIGSLFLFYFRAPCWQYDYQVVIIPLILW